MDKVGQKSLEIMSLAKGYNRWLFSQMEPYVKGQILEVGSGIGNFSAFLSKKGELTATDISRNYIESLKKLFRKEQVGFADIENGRYSFARRKFDTIVCLNVLEHIKDDNRAIGNLYNLLKKGGNLIIIVPAHQIAFGIMDKNLGHFRRYSKGEIVKKLTGNKFIIKKVRYLNILGLLGWFTTGKVLKKKILPQSQLTIFDKIARPVLFLENYVEFPLGLSVFLIAER